MALYRMCAIERVYVLLVLLQGDLSAEEAATQTHHPVV